MKFLKEPLTIDMDPFSEERLKIHNQILSRKKMIRQVFDEFHREMFTLAEKHLSLGEMEIELGAGVYPLKNSRSQVIATDILPAAHLDRVLDAQDMDLADNSTSVLYGQNCFHHFPQPELFFKELSRVLHVGGGAILIEPHYGILAQAIYKRLFAVEGYDKDSKDWAYISNGAGKIPNQALSYVCLIRDKRLFEANFPQLELVEHRPSSNWMRYLLSGGLNFKQLLPNFFIPLIKTVEWLLRPILPALALHTYFVIRKKI